MLRVKVSVLPLLLWAFDASADDRAHSAQAIGIPVLNRQIKAKEIIQAEDLIEKQVKDKISSQVIRDVDQIIGMSAKITLIPGRPILTTHLTCPVIIEKGRKINALYKKPSLSIEVQAIAQQNGSLGQKIRIKHGQNNVAFAKILDQNTVLIQD